MCAMCVARVRVISGNRRCALCKADNEHVVAASAEALGVRGFDDFGTYGSLCGPELRLDDGSGMFFHASAWGVLDALRALRAHVCGAGEPPCALQCRDLSSLQRHLATAHRGTQLCDLCASHRAVFVSELPRFSPRALAEHCASGDPAAGFAGHPLCAFCHTRFYDDTALYAHLQRDHFHCHLCGTAGGAGAGGGGGGAGSGGGGGRGGGGRGSGARAGDAGGAVASRQYYATYADLERHFSKAHYACPHEGCKSARFLAFASPIDLQAHLAAFHAETADVLPHLSFKFSRARGGRDSHARHQAHAGAAETGARSGSDEGSDSSGAEEDGGRVTKMRFFSGNAFPALDAAAAAAQAAPLPGGGGGGSGGGGHFLAAAAAGSGALGGAAPPRFSDGAAFPSLSGGVGVGVGGGVCGGGGGAGSFLSAVAKRAGGANVRVLTPYTSISALSAIVGAGAGGDGARFSNAVLRGESERAALAAAERAAAEGAARAAADAAAALSDTARGGAAAERAFPHLNGSAPPARVNDGLGWRCASCTLDNEGGASLCAVCGACAPAAPPAGADPVAELRGALSAVGGGFDKLKALAGDFRRGAIDALAFHGRARALFEAAAGAQVGGGPPGGTRHHPHHHPLRAFAQHLPALLAALPDAALRGAAERVHAAGVAGGGGRGGAPGAPPHSAHSAHAPVPLPAAGGGRAPAPAPPAAGAAPPGAAGGEESGWLSVPRAGARGGWAAVTRAPAAPAPQLPAHAPLAFPALPPLPPRGAAAAASASLSRGGGGGAKLENLKQLEARAGGAAAAAGAGAAPAPPPPLSGAPPPDDDFPALSSVPVTASLGQFLRAAGAAGGGGVVATGASRGAPAPAHYAHSAKREGALEAPEDAGAGTTMDALFSGFSGVRVVAKRSGGGEKLGAAPAPAGGGGDADSGGGAHPPKPRRAKAAYVAPDYPDFSGARAAAEAAAAREAAATANKAAAERAAAAAAAAAAALPPAAAAAGWVLDPRPAGGSGGAAPPMPLRAPPAPPADGKRAAPAAPPWTVQQKVPPPPPPAPGGSNWVVQPAPAPAPAGAASAGDAADVLALFSAGGKGKKKK